MGFKKNKNKNSSSGKKEEFEIKQITTEVNKHTEHREMRNQSKESFALVSIRSA